MINDCPADPAGSLPGSRQATTIRASLIPAMLAAIASVFIPSVAPAQMGGGSSEVFAGGQFESYLRYLQTLGKSRPTVWSIRGLSFAEVDALAPSDTLHPWASRYNFRGWRGRGLEWDYVRPTVGLTVNSSFPYGSNDGPIWAGKGLTSSAQAGLALRWGVLSARLAPIAFRSENQSFDLMSNGQRGRLVYANGQFPLEIDLPQRFGAGAYARLDPGESTVRIDVGGAAAGVSTASQWWGPTVDYPYILGNNAGGFPHAFFGTSRPANIGVGSLHGRVIYGRLDQSPFSSVSGSDYFETYLLPGKLRFMAGLIGVAQIRGIRGFEIGGARFFHSAVGKDGIEAEDIKLPFQNFLKGRLRNEGDTVFGDDRSLLQNQLASAYFRWAPPESGFELYGEYGREDFSFDFRDYLIEPDHSATLNVGFRKAWMRGAAMNAVRAEVFTYSAAAGTRTRGEGLIYLHQPLRQGHTLRGQMLGANVGSGSGSAQSLAFERFTPGGRMKGFFARVTQAEISAREPAYVSGDPIERPAAVQYSFGAELGRFVGPFDFTGRAAIATELNRFFESDKTNANLSLMIRQGF